MISRFFCLLSLPLRSDEFFYPVLQKIDGVINEKKVQLLQGVHWTQRFMDAVESRPFLTDLGPIQNQHCQAMNDPKIPATHRVQVCGRSRSSARSSASAFIVYRNFIDITL